MHFKKKNKQPLFDFSLTFNLISVVFIDIAVNSMPHTSVSMSSNMINTNEKKKVFVTGSGNIEVTQVSQPISHSPIVTPNITPNITTNVSSIRFLVEKQNVILNCQLLIGDSKANSTANNKYINATTIAASTNYQSIAYERNANQTDRFTASSNAY